MSFVQPANIHVIAESLGLRVKEEAAQALAPDVEYRLREIIQEGAKFMLHAKRSYLTPDDVNSALRLRNIEPLYGFTGSDPVRFLRTAGFPDVFYAEDPEQGIDQVLVSPLPKCPVEVGVVPHWLAIDGVQPVIPENTPLERTRIKRPRLDKKPAGAGPAASAPAAAAAAKPAPAAGAAAAAEDGGTGGTATGGGGGTVGGTTLVRAPVKHVVSQELQLYFDRVARLLRGAQPAAAQQAEPLQRAVLASLACDPGLQPLAPYLVKLLSEGVGSQLKSLPQLRLLLSAARALVMNPHLDLSPYLHQLMPALMTCLVAKRMGVQPGEDHWGVRDQAANVVAAVCRRYSGDYQNIAPRVQKTLLKALQDPAKPLTTHYGAVMGLAALGPRVVQLLLLPSLQPYMALLGPKLAAADAAASGAGGAAGGSSAARVAGALARLEALKVQGALLAAVAHAVFQFMGTGGSVSAPPGSAHDAAATGAAEGAAAAAAAGPRGPGRPQAVPLPRGRGQLAPPTQWGPARQQAALLSAQPGAQLNGGQPAAAAAAAAVALMFPAEEAEDDWSGIAAGAALQALHEQQQLAAAQLYNYAERHGPLRPANGGTGAAVEAAAEATAAAARAAGEKNELAEAWREDVDPAVAAHVVYRVFGEGVLPYLPGGALAGVLL